MCGRYGSSMSLATMSKRLGIPSVSTPDDVTPAEAWNIPPSFTVSAGYRRVGDDDKLDIDAMRWGFLPSWASDKKVQPINARLDKSDGKFWRKAFERRRAVVPVDWWYEWRKETGGKQPYAIRPAGNTAGFFFACVWSVPKSLPDDDPWSGSRTFAIVTTEAHSAISAIHSRMPVALTDEGARAWLEDGDKLGEVAERASSGMANDSEFWPVWRAVNSPGNTGRKIAEPVEGAEL